MMPAWGWIVLCIGAFCFGWTLGADWLHFKPRARRRVRSVRGSVGDYYVDPEKGDDEGDGSKEKPFKTISRLQAEFIGRPKPNRFCGLTGCEIRRPHSHTEEEFDESDVGMVLDAYEEADSEIAELEAKLKGEDLDEKAPAVAEVLNTLTRDQQYLQRLEKLLVEDGSASAKLALTRLEEWRKDTKHDEEDL